MTRSLVVIAVAGEGVLVVVALTWQRLRDVPLAAGDLWDGVAAGTATAVALALVNWYLLCGAPSLRPVTAIRRLYRDSLQPAFGGVGVVDVAVISVAAGIGEELLFRGVLQAEMGLVLASVIFGVLHTGGHRHPRVRRLGSRDGRRARRTRDLDRGIARAHGGPCAL